MSPTVEDQIEGLKHTIAEMETQRGFLGDEVVDIALAPFQRKLDELMVMLQTREAHLHETYQQQRKLVTLLFMDIVGSTSIAQHMDPEDVSEVFDVTLKKLAQPVEDHDGRVTRFMGDGFLAVFGAPTAREDDPERSVRAGLAIIELAGEISAELEQKWQIHDFQIRVGVNTGVVMLGGETEAEYTLMGSAVNLAARVESAAPAGVLLVSHETYRHIRGVFDVEPWEPLQVKGFDEPVRVYRILRARPRAFRVFTRGVEGVETQMVGREAELKYLQDALLSAIEEGEGQVVTITGEAGMGKSRLLYEFQDWIELLPPPSVRFFQARANPEAMRIPCGLLRDLFAFRFQIQDDDGGEVVREKITSGFGEVFISHPDGEMRAHLLGQWLGFDFSSSPYLKIVLGDPEQLHNRGLMYIGEYFKSISSQQPVVIFLEDIHWADDSSLDVLNWLGERIHHQQLVIVCTARPMLLERRPYWGEGLADHHCLGLEPLSKAKSSQLVLEILKFVEKVPPELRELVVNGAEGNPFYIEELIKMFIENGIIIKGEGFWQVHLDSLVEPEVPPTLTVVLQARLDSLPGKERTVLQQASVVGRKFWDSTVAYIQAAEAGKVNTIPEALTALRNRELIYRQEESAFTDAQEYIFKHDILREVTYESVLKRLRRIYHGMVADWLIAHAEERAGEYSGLIAGHLLQAGHKEQAGNYFLRAGELALQSYANAEAEAYFRKALELLVDQPHRAACLAGLGEALGKQALRESAVESLRQAIELYHRGGEHDRVADLYTHLSQVLWYDDYKKAWEACQEGLERLKDAPEGPGLARLLAEAGRTAYFRSQPAEVIAALCQRAIHLADQLGEQKAKAEASITIAQSLREIDPDKSISMLQEIAASTEANGLLAQADRAYNNLYMSLSENLQSLESAYQSGMRSAEISAQIGSIDGLFLTLENVAQSLIELGQLGEIEERLAEILRGCSASLARVDEFLDEQRSWLLYYLGNWTEALEFHRQRLRKLREGGSYQFIANHNITLAWVILELNRFMGAPILSDAEDALCENIEMNWYALPSRYLLAVINSRQKHFARAHELLAEAVNMMTQYETKATRVNHLETEVELAMAEERWDDAVSTCQSVIDLYQAGGYNRAVARTLIDLGDALARRSGPGDLERAQEKYHQSLEMYMRMGAPGYIRALEERLGRDQTTGESLKL
jgi:predicted ATPase/class 3 adenylate cyclase